MCYTNPQSHNLEIIVKAAMLYGVIGSIIDFIVPSLISVRRWTDGFEIFMALSAIIMQSFWIKCGIGKMIIRRLEKNDLWARLEPASPGLGVKSFQLVRLGCFSWQYMFHGKEIVNC